MMLLGIMLLFILSSSALLLFYSRELNESQNAPFAAFDFANLPSMGIFECTIARTDANGFVLGTMRVWNKEVRIDLHAEQAHIIVRDGVAYAWHADEPAGVSQSATTITAALNDPREPEKKVSCKRAIYLDKKLFTLPSNITF